MAKLNVFFPLLLVFYEGGAQVEWRFHLRFTYFKYTNILTYKRTYFYFFKGKSSSKKRRKKPNQQQIRAKERKSRRKHFKPLAGNQKEVGMAILRQIHKTIHHYWPDLFDRFAGLSDPRKGAEYSISEIITAALCMFLLKRQSRNQMNLLRRESRYFRKNYRKLFRFDLPDMDIVEDVFRLLEAEELERLKAVLVRELIRKKVLCKHRLYEGSIIIAVDGFHHSSYDADYCGECTWQTSSGGKTTWFHKALEAKIVTASGLSLSVATEWISNDGSQYDKQDCELKAFTRLAQKLKSYFPRMKICMLGDGLYPNQTVFSICRDNQWEYILTFKDGNLPSVWKEVELLRHCAMQHHKEEWASKDHLLKHEYSWINDIEYEKINLHWIECLETKVEVKTGECREGRFVHLCSLPPSRELASMISRTGRLRWKIENEGFNIQKNHGYNLGHKFSRVSFNALKNYYQCMQIAHMINQLTVHSRRIQELIEKDPKITLKFIWEQLTGLLSFTQPPIEDIENRSRRRCQIILV